MALTCSYVNELKLWYRDLDLMARGDEKCIGNIKNFQ